MANNIHASIRGRNVEPTNSAVLLIRRGIRLGSMVGILPFEWNDQNGLICEYKKPKQRYWSFLNFCLDAIIRLSIGVYVIWAWKGGHLQTKDKMVGMYLNLANTWMLGYTFLTHFRIKELIAFYNGMLQHLSETTYSIISDQSVRIMDLVWRVGYVVSVNIAIGGIVNPEGTRLAFPTVPPDERVLIALIGVGMGFIQMNCMTVFGLHFILLVLFLSRVTQEINISLNAIIERKGISRLRLVDHLKGYKELMILARAFQELNKYNDVVFAFTQLGMGMLVTFGVVKTFPYVELNVYFTICAIFPLLLFVQSKCLKSMAKVCQVSESNVQFGAGLPVCWRREWRALRPIRVGVGNLFYFGGNVFPYFHVILNNTLTLILSVKLEK